MADDYVERAREAQELEEFVDRQQTLGGFSFAVAGGLYYIGLNIGGAAIMNPLAIVVALAACVISWRVFSAERRVKRLRESLEG